MQSLEPITRIRKSYHIKCYRIPTPGSNQYSNHILQLPEQDFVSQFHIQIPRTQKEEPNKLLLIFFNAYVSNSILHVLVSHLPTGLQVPVPSCLESDISSTHLWTYHNTGTAAVFPL